MNSNDRARTLPLLPLGALAAGFGLAPLASAQAPAAAPVPPAAASSPAASETMLPVVRAKASAEPTGKQAVQATTSRIGKGKQDLRDIPQSVTVVTERVLDDRNLDTLKDALKNTAGISFQAAEGGEEDIRLRGFSLQSSGDIFIDGMRDPAFYERDSFAWDRLEVLRGSASMLFGRGSTGGAVNQVSKQPRLVNENEVAVTVGSGSYLRGTLDVNRKLGENAAFRLNAMLNLADNSGNKIDKRGVAPTLSWGIGTADELTVGLYHLENDNGIHYGLPWLPPGASSGGNYLWPTPPKNYYGAASDTNRTGTDQFHASHIHRLVGGGEVRTALRVAEYRRDQRASAIRFADTDPATAGNQPPTADSFGSATVLTRGTNNKKMDMDTVYLQSDYSGKYGWFGLKHTVQAGLDIAQEKFENFGFSLPAGVTLAKGRTSVGTPNDGLGSVDETLRVAEVNRRFTARALGAYAQDLVQMAPAWKLLAGVRWDKLDGDYLALAAQGQPTQNVNGQQVPNPCYTPANTGYSRGDSLWSKRLGVLFQPTPLQSYHFSYGTSFNTAGDTYQFDAGTANTPPESSRNLELGARIDSDSGNFTTRVALFHATKYNERNRDSESVDACNYVLSGKRHAAGIELDLSGRITPQWEVFGSYAFIPMARVDESSGAAGTEVVGSRPGLTPRHSGTIWTTYQVTPRWRVGGGINARSSDVPVGLAANSAIVAPSFVTADLMAEYTVGDLSYKFNITNLTDKHYADVLYRGHYVPGKPRTIQLTAAYKF
jgi:catecholate siderophore receptor